MRIAEKRRNEEIIEEIEDLEEIEEEIIEEQYCVGCNHPLGHLFENQCPCQYRKEEI